MLSADRLKKTAPMFRLIALALVTTFALLAFFGAGMDGPTFERGQLDVARMSEASMSDSPDSPAATAAQPDMIEPGARYLTAVELALLRAPEPGAEVVARVSPGVPVLVVAPAERGFAQVTAENGQTGYVFAGALAPPSR